MSNKKIILYPNITQMLATQLISYIWQKRKYIEEREYGRDNGILLDFGSNNIVLLYNTKTSIIAVKGED